MKKSLPSMKSFDAAAGSIGAEKAARPRIVQQTVREIPRTVAKAVKSVVKKVKR